MAGFGGEGKIGDTVSPLIYFALVENTEYHSFDFVILARPCDFFVPARARVTLTGHGSPKVTFRLKSNFRARI